jgi:glycosyltransferase involved in cell wall biosynthesis
MKVAMLLTDNREELREYDKPNPFFGPAPSALLEGLSNRPDIELHVISCTKRPMLAPQKLAENIWFHLLHVKQWGWLRSLYSGCLFAIWKKLAEIGPDLVHGQGTERYCALAAVLSGFPNVITIHGNMRAIAKTNDARILSYDWCAAKLEQFTLPRTDGVICVSSYTRSLVSAVARRTWLIPNAVSERFFRERSNPLCGQNILCAATICLIKNQNALIRSLDSLATQKTFRLVFVGRSFDADPYFREFLQLIKTRPWCVYKGLVDREQLMALFSETAALALPSLEDNCPMIILEAAASCVPVIAANIGGVPDLVRHEETGLLFDPSDATAIASAAARYLSDPEFAKRMAKNAKMAAEAAFHPQNIAKQHIDAYAEVLKN